METVEKLPTPSDLREHTGAVRELVAAGREINATAKEGIQTAKELPGLVGQEVRDTTTHAGYVAGGAGGFLMVLWFIIKLILIYLASRK